MKNRMDAVKMVRKIRDRLHEQTRRLSRSELIEFYRHGAKQVRSRLKARSKTAAA